MKNISNIFFITFFCFSFLCAGKPKKLNQGDVCRILKGNYKEALATVIKKKEISEVLSELENCEQRISQRSYDISPSTSATEFSVCFSSTFEKLFRKSPLILTTENSIIFSRDFFTAVEMLFRKGEQFYEVEINNQCDENSETKIKYIYASSWLEYLYRMLEKTEEEETAQ